MSIYACVVSLKSGLIVGSIFDKSIVCDIINRVIGVITSLIRGFITVYVISYIGRLIVAINVFITGLIITFIICLISSSIFC